MLRGFSSQLFRWAARYTNLAILLIFVVCLVSMVGCTVDERPHLDQLLPPQVGYYVRVHGPAPDPNTSVDFAEYQGPDGSAVLRIKLVGKDQINHALSQLPPSASDVRADPGLGWRTGSFFSFAGEYHAAWGNGDWVFILSTPSEAVLAVFLSSYGY